MAVTQIEEKGNADRTGLASHRPDLMGAIAALAPLVAAHTDAMERDRRMAVPLVQALRSSGLLRLCLPRELGGLEADPETVIKLIEAVAALDGSVGWNFLVGITHAYFAAYLPEAVVREIWGVDPDVIVASSFGPNGRAVIVDGGYRVTGRWGFSSGIHQASWLCGGCTVFDGDHPQLGAQGDPDRLLLFFPKEDAEILDTWNTGGLRGTGSNDFAVSNLFVPADRGFDLMHTVGRTHGPLYCRPFLGEGNLHGTAFAAVALGIARHAITAFSELANGKVPAGRSRALLRDRPMAQIQVSQAEALVQSARAFLVDATRQAWTSTVERGAPTELEIARVRLAIVHAGESSVKATELMHRAGGATSIYNSSALDRCLRDVYTATKHIQMSPEHYFAVGATLMSQSSAES